MPARFLVPIVLATALTLNAEAEDLNPLRGTFRGFMRDFSLDPYGATMKFRIFTANGGKRAVITSNGFLTGPVGEKYPMGDTVTLRKNGTATTDDLNLFKTEASPRGRGRWKLTKTGVLLVRLLSNDRTIKRFSRYRVREKGNNNRLRLKIDYKNTGAPKQTRFLFKGTTK